MVRNFLPISSSAGVKPLWSGEDLCDSRAKEESSDLVIKSLAV